MRKVLILAPLALLSACAGSVTLNADKAFLTAQIAFKASQQIAFAEIKSGVLTGSAKEQVIALIDKAQAAENAAYTTHGTAVALMDIVSQLSALGVH